MLTWQDESSSAYVNCLAWNPMRANEFCLGGSSGIVYFCNIVEQSNEANLRLQVVRGHLPSSISEQASKASDITACAYLLSITNLLLCSTNGGFVTCWNSRTNACLLHWKADSNEICYMATVKHRLLTGSSTGCLRLWNTENLEANLGQANTRDS